jgi:predicted Zn-dependent protease
MAGGALAGEDVLGALDTGIYVGNLWYCNFSDRMNCRITGMTRFGSFWVEGGKIVAPLNAMRFDDSLFRMFGDHLEALTASPELILDPHSYEARSTESARLPGALIRGLTLTL